MKKRYANIDMMFRPTSGKKWSWEIYINLVWLVFLVYQPLFDDSSSYRDWLLIAFIVVCFLVVYFWTIRQSMQKRKARVAVGLAALLGSGLIFANMNAGASSFFIYAASVSAYAFRWRTALWWVVAAFGCSVIAALLSPVPFPYNLVSFLPTILMCLIIGGLSVFRAEQGRAEVKLQMANEEIERLATIAERERIARDLHDVLGHTLSVIALKSELANKLLEQNPSRAKEEMQDVERISREALSEVRSAVTGYRAKGLTSEVAHAKLALESAGVSFAYQNTATQLSSLQESTLSLVIREAVTNIIRHSKATRCAISLTETENDLTLEIADNGQGCKGEEGSGLSGMRERVQALGGNLKLGSVGGLRLRVTLPKQLSQQPLANLQEIPA
jgi:two-component system, NarL family, sensor histidine kinase DesK